MWSASAARIQPNASETRQASRQRHHTCLTASASSRPLLYFIHRVRPPRHQQQPTGFIRSSQTRYAHRDYIIVSHSTFIVSHCLAVEKRTQKMKALHPVTPSSSSKSANSDSPNTNWNPSPVQPLVARLWRPASQRNLRNQWSKLANYWQQWNSYSSAGRSHATSLVNAYLSQTYMPSMELGVLGDMHGIREKACQKLYRQQELYRRSLVSSYKDMVVVVIDMIKASKSMRCYLKGTSRSPLVQFSDCCEDKNDLGDGVGIPVFAFSSIAPYEKLAEEIVQMFITEVNLKRLLAVDLLSISCDVSVINTIRWSDELYPGEFDDLRVCNLYCTESCEPLCPRLEGYKSDTPIKQSNQKPNHDVIMQAYIATWLAEPNIDTYRVGEIVSAVGEEMHFNLL